MTNFDYLLKIPCFSSFADIVIAAEKSFQIDAATCVVNCRRAMEAAIKWMYSVEESLPMPYQDSLSCLMSTPEFDELIEPDLMRRLQFIRRVGNNAAHSGKRIVDDQAKLCLQNLFVFMDYLSYCYDENYVEREYDESLLDGGNKAAVDVSDDSVMALQALMMENQSLKAELSVRRAEQQKTYVAKPIDISEYKTRKLYIDSMLTDAGWIEGKDWMNEVELEGMPNKSNVGFADYVLYDDTYRPLAVIEAKKTCVDVATGRQQAKLYADLLEKKYHRRPIIFLTNGFETRIVDGQYPERKVAAIYSKRDLEKVFNLRSMRTSLLRATVDKNIAGRYYQEAAIKSVAEAFETQNRRKALLVMATGSGKTRTVIALCKMLFECGWVKNVLFLADRSALVTQAKRSFYNLLPDYSGVNLAEDRTNYNARCVFSTYQTMENCIDAVRDDDGKLFTCGHFDLVICDEAHRSIYNKYKDIFAYFDAPLVGLTATPKDEVDRNTYGIFGLQEGNPTYAYELSQAVKDGFLVDYRSVETQLKFVEQGIVYDELSEEEKEEYESTFEQEDGDLPEKIASSALNTWVFNRDTICQVLSVLMKDGIHVDYGNKLGKTIIFAKNHKHAEEILKVFNEEYPHLPGFAQVVDNTINYAQTLIDQFSDPMKLPQIAISVDMLDTGIDIPEILNLVFFKKVMSKAKFWQMIGRGTRLCPGLIDGKDKEHFYIFDFCGNFEFFRLNQEKPSANMIAIQGAIFNFKFGIAYKLQDINYQVDRMIEYRKALVKEMTEQVKELNKENFAVRQHLRYVEQYSEPHNYTALTYEDTLMVREEVAPLILPEGDEVTALRFDALMYRIELLYLSGRPFGREQSDLLRRVNGIASVAVYPEIRPHIPFIQKILTTDYLERAGIEEFEEIRKTLRELVKYIPKEKVIYITNFTDDIIDQEWNEPEYSGPDLENYRQRVEHYIRQHQDERVIAKLRINEPLNESDIKDLERIVWEDIGSKQEYEMEYGTKPLGELVREIVGLDMGAAKAAFAEFLDSNNLNSRQIYFVNQIVEYIVQNGMMKDLSVLQEAPFTDRGSIVEVFDDLNVWMGIRKVIDCINANAAA